MKEKIHMEIDSNTIRNIFGDLDENIMLIENTYSVNIANRGEQITIFGEKEGVELANKVIKKLVDFAKKGEEIGIQRVSYLISTTGDEGFKNMEKINDEFVAITAMGKPIKPKTLGQKKYLENIKKNEIVFAIGPAGTGKTYLAMAKAITAFKNNEVNRIILTRPAIEAGESLGFLPGDLQQKVDPYLRPLYDALHEIMGSENFMKNLEKGKIEIAPLAYMRGRTLDNAFIVLDEAQNTTPEQMKMFLTRIGYGSKVIITGDLTQIDLPTGKRSGIIEAVEILDNIEGIGISRLTNKDVVRNPLVKKIVEAYDAYDNKKVKKVEVKQEKNKSKDYYRNYNTRTRGGTRRNR